MRRAALATGPGLAAHLRRLVHLLRVMVGHLLAEAVTRRPRLAPLARFLPAPGLSGPERLRTAFEELGGTFIKFGQMLALQPDILSIEYCNALFKLLDRVEPFPYEDVERTFREDLGSPPEEVFDRFETASFAAASVGQVHRAWLGERKLAVKVRRPTVLTDFAGDLQLMRLAMALVRRLRLRPLYWTLEPMGEFVAWTEEELDYRTEARYLERQRANSTDNPKERVPEVVGELSGERILVLEFLEGMPVLDHVRALEAGDEVAARRLAAIGFEPDAFARAIIDNFLSDAFLHGMFHADLHPANLLILPGNVVGYIDFGITGVLSAYSRRHLVGMTLGYTRGDLDGMCEAFFKVSTVDPGSDLAAFRDGLRTLATSWYVDDGRDRRLSKNFTLVMLEMLRLSRTTGVLPEREVVKYIRSAIALDGLITRFAPSFDLGSYLGEVCDRHLRRHAAAGLLGFERWFEASQAGGRLARNGLLRGASLLDRLEAGELTVRGVRSAGAVPPSSFVGAAAAVFVLSVLLASGEPAPPGPNPFTVQAALWGASLAVFARSFRRAFRNKEV